MDQGAGSFVLDLYTVAVLAVFYLIVVGYPAWRILRRLGYDTRPRVFWLVALALVPYIALWGIALANWPAIRTAGDREHAG